MRITCLCPTYGRRPDLLGNAIACFLSQTHEDKRLIVLDDAGTVGHRRSGQVLVHSTSNRFRSLPDKYRFMTDRDDPWTEAYVLWDDDDIYLPDHLARHDQVLQSRAWSYPDEVGSLYTGKLVVEPTGGRFWACIGFRRECLAKSPWPVTDRVDYDQQFLRGLERSCGHPGRPEGDITFVYRWGSTRAHHASGVGGSNWYAGNTPQYRDPYPRDYVVALDPETAVLILQERGLDLSSRRWPIQAAIQASAK